MGNKTRNNFLQANMSNQESLKQQGSISICEQELNINTTRDSDSAIIYASDSTYITKLDKLCAASPDMYSLMSDTGRGKTYLLKDKTLISFRGKKRELTEEQRIAAGERMRNYHQNK